MNGKCNTGQQNTHTRRSSWYQASTASLNKGSALDQSFHLRQLKCNKVHNSSTAAYYSIWGRLTLTCKYQETAYAAPRSKDCLAHVTENKDIQSREMSDDATQRQKGIKVTYKKETSNSITKVTSDHCFIKRHKVVSAVTAVKGRTKNTCSSY